ncbi:MAG: apolipoprotein N-acyltransferase [Gammaproteobacteria bacterium RIFCSPHIGHO2_12_FULL_45_9]|nr:MAG: apolipoprotein N-acyltransferase [Gammaproteobacteria bacterium RIFCSPHIGHO2_12_FULL_45_9]
MRNNRLRYISQQGLALCTGACYPLAFAPWRWWPLALLSLCVLLHLWLSHSKPRRAAWLGFLWGVGAFGIGVSWVYISMHRYGGANMLVAGSITALLVFALSTFPAMTGYALKRFTHASLPLTTLLLFPTLWVAFDLVRTFILTGFPWLLLGYTQTETPLLSLAPIISVYGISWLVALCVGALVWVWHTRTRKQGMLAGGLITTIVMISWLLSLYTWTTPRPTSLRVALVQGNISQDEKWVPGALERILSTYVQETTAHWGDDIIVWPEAAIPTFPQNIPEFIHNLSRAAASHQTGLIVGIPTQHDHHYWNSIIGLGTAHGTYDKQHLVPFGEYTPLARWLKPLSRLVNIPMSDFSAAPRPPQPIWVNNVPVATFLCYEVAYAFLVDPLAKQAQLIVIASDDSWFGDSPASSQQFQMAQLRAAETGRFVLYATNTGITGILSPTGKIVAQLPPNTTQTLSYTLHPTVGNTPFVIWL